MFVLWQHKEGQNIMSKAGDMRDKKRMENMGNLQNELVRVIDSHKLPLPDLRMVLAVLIRQVDDIFVSNLRSVKGKK